MTKFGLFQSGSGSIELEGRNELSEWSKYSVKWTSDRNCQRTVSEMAPQNMSEDSLGGGTSESVN